MSASNYRPVALMKTEAKLMSRMILMQLTKTLATHASQFGSGDCVGVIYPQMVIRQMAASAASNGLASCTLFVDIVAAFDRVLLPLLWGCNSRTGWQAAELLDDGFTAPQADMVVRFLAERPTLLSVCGLPAGLLAVLRVWGHASWWTVNGTDACSSALGVRQGDCLSAMVFDIFYSHVMDILQQRLRDSHVLTELVVPHGRSFYPDSSGSAVVNGPALALHGNATLVVAKEYGHLGCIFAQDLNLRGETSQMIARSRSAIKEKKIVLMSSRLTIPSRITLYTTYVRGHLLQNVAVLQPFHFALLARLRSEYIRGLRVATGQTRTAANLETISTDAMLLARKLSTLEVLMERRALMVFFKLCICDNMLVRAAISVYFGKGTMWERIFLALNQLRKCTRTGEVASLPVASLDTIGIWAQFVVVHHDAWPTIVGNYSGAVDADHDGLPELAHEDEHVDEDAGRGSTLPAEEAPFIGPVAMFQCDTCDFASRTRAGLRMHERRAHKQFDALSLRTTSPKCPCCDLNFGLRTRVLDHYRTSVRCGRFVMEHCEPLSPTSFAQMLERNQNVDETDSRQFIPKAGRKPPGQRPPMCAVSAVFVDSDQLAASRA
eukprot:5389359-Amphidinium_carterae.2